MMIGTTFARQMDANRVAYERSCEQLRAATPGHYAAIAEGRLVAVRETFDEAVSEVEQLRPMPEHFLVFPVGDEPAFAIIDDYTLTFRTFQ